MKLTSNDIRKMIASQIVNVEHLYINDDDIMCATNPGSWKRFGKMRMPKALETYGVETIEDFIDPEAGFDDITILDDQPITNKCIVRCLVVEDLTLDCTVVSDESDSKVIVMMWHQD